MRIPKLDDRADVLHPSVEGAAELGDEFIAKEIGGCAEPDISGISELLDRVDRE